MDKSYLRKLLSIFPENYCFAFAYGSAIYPQSLNPTRLPPTAGPPVGGNQQQAGPSSSNMIDLVLVVRDSLSFHQENLKRNSSHYSFVRFFGPKMVTSLQDNFAARVYYNSLIQFVDENKQKKLMKYGVISHSRFVNDLLDWDSLYIAGRLHKPVKIIHEADRELSKIIAINHQNAWYAALLLLDETFSEEQLFTAIASLSYDGDFRMIFGEDKNKVLKIVKPNIDKFRHIYQPFIGSSVEKGLLSYNQNQRIYFQDCSPRVVFHNLLLLPKRVQQNLYFSFEKQEKLRDLDDVLMSLAQNYHYRDYVKNAIKQIVRKSSWSQSLKGILTAGIIKSIHYSSRKIIKMKSI